MRRILVLIGLCLLGSAADDKIDPIKMTPEDEALLSAYEEFKIKYGVNKEGSGSFENFKQNLRLIESHNRMFDEGKVTYKLGMNEYGDMDLATRSSRLRGTKIDTSVERFWNKKPVFPKAGKEAIDWRKHGYVTEVKNQGDCSSCWAFATVGALEGQYKNVSGTLVSLSEQELVDCGHKFGTRGCKGSSLILAFRYIEHTGGLSKEEDYVYRKEQNQDDTGGQCSASSYEHVAKVKGIVWFEPVDEEELKNAVAAVGPIATHMHAATARFDFYREGILDNPDCPSNRNAIDHAVLIVGYGTLDGKDYWIVKNSWGKNWGTDGYFRIVRNKNMCSIASQVVYPIMAT